MMQNGDIYTEVNKNTAKYTEIQEFLNEQGQLLSWGPEEVILDVGCGPGDLTANVLQQWLPKDFRFLLGVDISAKLIKHAQAVNANEKLEFKTVDIGGDISEVLKSEKYTGGFDKVLSFYVLHWLEDLQKGISNLYSLMKSGGQAVVTFPIDRHFQRTYKEVRAKKQWSGYFKNVIRHLPPFPTTADPIKEFTMMLDAEGFEVKRCQVQDNLSHFDTLLTVTGLIESLDQDIDCVPLELKQQYLDDCLQVMESMKALDMKKNSVLQTMLTCVFRKPKSD